MIKNVVSFLYESTSGIGNVSSIENMKIPSIALGAISYFAVGLSVATTIAGVATAVVLTDLDRKKREATSNEFLQRMGVQDIPSLPISEKVDLFERSLNGKMKP